MKWHEKRNKDIFALNLFRGNIGNSKDNPMSNIFLLVLMDTQYVDHMIPPHDFIKNYSIFNSEEGKSLADK